MSEQLDGEEIVYRIEERWNILGYENLLQEEQDYILAWWLEVEAGGGLYQYFSQHPGDGALEAVDALQRLPAPNAAQILSEAIAIFGEEYPADLTVRDKALESMPGQGYDVFDDITDRLFAESEPIRSLAIDRVGDAYLRENITGVPTTGWPAMRVVATVVLVAIALSFIVLAATLAT